MWYGINWVWFINNWLCSKIELEKRIDGDTKEHKSSDVGTNNQKNNIIQNFNSGITYKEARQIAEEVVEDRLSTINKRKNKK